MSVGREINKNENQKSLGDVALESLSKCLVGRKFNLKTPFPEENGEAVVKGVYVGSIPVMDQTYGGQRYFVSVEVPCSSGNVLTRSYRIEQIRNSQLITET